MYILDARISIYIYIWKSIYIYIHTKYVYMYMYTYMYMYMYACMYVRMHVLTYVWEFWALWEMARLQAPPLLLASATAVAAAAYLQGRFRVLFMLVKLVMTVVMTLFRKGTP